MRPRLASYDADPDSPAPEEPGVIRRLFIAGALIVLLALTCYYLLPRIGMMVPWYVPVIGFAVILVSTLAQALSGGVSLEPVPDEPPGEGPLRADIERFGRD